MINISAQSVCILKKEYTTLKKKEVIPDNLLLQLDSSLNDLEVGRVKKVR